jgi:hypothetical protein
MKPKLNLIQVCLLCALMLSAVVQAQDYIYTTNNDGTLTITGYIGSGGVVFIPGTINNFPVTSIGDWAFYSTDVTNVTIPDSVTNIGDGVFFDCESLTNVTIGNSVIDIGNWTFAFCSSLTSVNFRGDVPSLGGADVFYGNLATVYYLLGGTNWGPTFEGHPAVLWNPPVLFNYTVNINNDKITITGYTGSDGAVTIPSMINFLPVSSIGNSAFNFNSGLTNIIIPDGVTSIGSSAFLYCDKLISVAIPNSVTNIGSGAFQWCKNLTSVTIPYGVTSFTDSVFYDCISLANITFSTNITSIGGDAFWGCVSLSSFIIPNSVTNIGDGAFSGTGLTSVTIPYGITSIGYITFSDCASLTNVTIPESVINITSWAFSYCGSLTSVTIPNGVNTIEYGVFYDCPNLTSVIFGNGVTSILQDAFWITGLTNINIPNNVTSIDAGAFASTSLTNVTIGNGVTSMGDTFYACPFYACPNLMAITVDVNNPAFCSVNGVLFNKNLDTLIEYPRGLVGSYTVSDSVTSIGNYAFYYCPNLTGVYFKGNAPGPGEFAFTGDNNAITYYLPGTTGWPGFATNTGLTIAPWFLPNPTILNFEPNFGMQTNGFGFTISWATNAAVVVESSTNLSNPAWAPINTNALVNGTNYFNDPQWTNYSSRFYRLRSP